MFHALGGRLGIVTGRETEIVYFDTLEVERKPTFGPNDREDLADYGVSFHHGGSLMLAGGGFYEGTTAIYRFDTLLGRWILLEQKLKSKRTKHAAVVVSLPEDRVCRDE